MRTAIIIFSYALIIVKADIDCYSCGYGPLCPLPFNQEDLEVTGKVSCQKSCLKFDGLSDEDGKRVIIRTCSTNEFNGVINECKEEQRFNGATGKACLCNASNCNAGSSLMPQIIFIFLILAIVCNI